MKIKSIYDLTAEFKGERRPLKPIRDLKKVSPYAISRRTNRRLELTANRKRYESKN